MRDLMSDYRQLVLLPVGQVEAWVSGELHAGVRGQWISAMLDIAITVYYSVNESPEATPRRRVELAAALLGFAAKHRRIREVFIAEWYMRFSKKAFEEEAHGIPSSMTVDSVIRYSLNCFELTKEDAHACADNRARVGRDPVEIELSVIPGAAPSIGRKVLNIKFLLGDMMWFADKVSDPELKREVLSWLDIREQLRA